jgi:hypothetical protein
MTINIANSPASKLLLAINRLATGYNGRATLGVYQGTVSPATVAKRRAASKAARKARRKLEGLPN